MSLQRFDLSASPPRLESPVRVLGKFQGDYGWGNELRLAWSPDRPDRAYLLTETLPSRENGGPPSGSRSAIDLLTVSLDPGSKSSDVHRLELMDHLPGSVPADRLLPWPHVHRGILYLADVVSNPRTKLLRIDLLRSDSPVLLDVLELDRAVFQTDSEGSPQSLGILEIPGLDPRDRLEATFVLKGRYSKACIGEDLLVTWNHRGL